MNFVATIITKMRSITNKLQTKNNDTFTLVEKLVVLYYGLYIVREIFFTNIDIAFLKSRISEKEKNDWEHFFNSECELCKKIDLLTYQGCAWFEYKVRHLMDLAMNISFDEKPAWKGYSVSFENVLFPFLSRIDYTNN